MGEFEYIKYKLKFGDIKSSFIKKIIFSFLSEKKILNVIMYNKELQNMLSFDIEDYKEASKKYKIGEKDGKGKDGPGETAAQTTNPGQYRPSQWRKPVCQFHDHHAGCRPSDYPRSFHHIQDDG